MNLFYIPHQYTFLYNRKGIEGLAYFSEYYVPLLLFVVLSDGSANALITYFLAVSAFMSIYEIGYIENNVLAIEEDSVPTLRHTSKELLFLKKNLHTIFLTRYIIAALLAALMSFLVDITFFIVLLIAVRVIFYLYNIRYRRGLFHRILFALLRFLRYFSPIYFLGMPSALLSLLISLLNIINNYAWYDRSTIHLPRFFGTKLFDSLVYGGYYLYFVCFQENQAITYTFLYLAIVKMILFLKVIGDKYYRKFF